MAKLLKNQGYDTAMIGKWHLGMLFDGKEDRSATIAVGTKVSQGPIERGGFEHFIGFHHARQLGVLVKDQQVVDNITPVEMLPRLTKAAVAYIESRKDNTQPFFLYVPWSSPHGPVVPTKEWQDKSGLNPHADFVMQTDDSIGQVIAALKRNDLLQNTIVISTSDNGTSARTAVVKQLQKLGHYSSADLRGFKTDAWDGGHRVPFIISWPDVVKPGSVSDQLVSLNDVMATLADILDQPIADNMAGDSISFYPLLHQQTKGARADIIHHSVSGHFAIRQGQWKLVLAPGSGGTSQPKRIPGTQVQLYDMEIDKAEQNNLANKMPNKVKQLTALLQAQVDAGRSTPGPKLENAVAVNIFKTSANRKNNKVAGMAIQE